MTYLKYSDRFPASNTPIKISEPGSLGLRVDESEDEVTMGAGSCDSSCDHSCDGGCDQCDRSFGRSCDGSCNSGCDSGCDGDGVVRARPDDRRYA